MNCIKCKRSIPSDAIFCQYCGKKQLAGDKVRNPKVRGNGTGSAFKLPNGKWRVEVVVGKNENGRPMRRTKAGFKTKKEALEYIPILKNQPDKKKSITINEAFIGIQPKLEKLSKKRRECYTAAYRKIKKHEHRDLDTFSLSELQEIADNSGDGFYSKRYVKDLLSKLYKYAFVDGKVERNLAPHIELPLNTPVKEKEIFTNDEIAAIWNAWNSGDDFAGYILIIIYCALRTGELMSIKSKNVNFEKRIMTGGIKTNKGKYAPIYIVDEIEPVLRHFTTMHPEGSLYNDYSVKFYREWREFKGRLGLREDLEPYSGRHSCATILTNAGVPEAVIMAIMRHEKYDTTLGYTHIDVKSTLERMQSALKNEFGDELRDTREQ